MSKAFTIPSRFTAIDKLTAPIRKMQDAMVKFANRSETEVARLDRALRKVGKSSGEIAKRSAFVGLALAAPLIAAGHAAIKYEDAAADITKTSGLTGAALDKVNKGILDMAPGTRTTIENLQQLAVIAGQMGVKGADDVLSFVNSVDKFNVALGSDFGGTEAATRAIAQVKNLFQETRNLKIDDALTRAGSAINALTSEGVSAPQLTDFINRVGAFPDAMKPSIQATAALGAVMDKAGISSEIASRAYGDLINTASAGLPAFAKQMNLSQQAASKLINTDPAAFATDFAKSLKGLDAEQTAKTLKKLRLGDTGTVKFVGALGSATDQMAKYLKISNEEFRLGTSLLNEFGEKNSTTLAKLQRAQNGIQSFTITMGTELLPVLSEVLMGILPVVKQMTAWAQQNSNTVKTILKVVGVMSALSFAVSGISTAVSVATGFMKLMNYQIKGVTVATHIWNMVTLANPIGLIVISIIAMIAVIALVINKWNEWGAAVSLLMGPVGMVISLIQSFRRNWDMITDAFTKGGIVAGLKAIGATILDAILMPLQQVVKLIGNITGAQWAKDLDAAMQGFRASIGVNTTTDESGEPIVKPSLNPKIEALKAQTYNSTLTISDLTGRARMDNENPMISLMPVFSGTK